MAGPKANMKRGWELISSKIDMDTPSPIGKITWVANMCPDRHRLEKLIILLHMCLTNLCLTPLLSPLVFAAKEDYTEVHLE